MNQQQFFETVIQALEKLEIPYMVAGSVAAVVYGEPRMTNDMDVVVDLHAESVTPLADSFPAPEFYFPPRVAVLEEIRRRGQLNILHVASGSKVDLILRKDTEHGITEFPRRQLQPMTPALSAQFASPEDVIVAKLVFYSKGRSEKHLEDVAGVLRVQGNALDRAYLDRWIGKLELDECWQAALSRVGGDPCR